MNSNSSYHLEMLTSEPNCQFFTPCHLEIDGVPWKTIEHHFYFKLLQVCASFQSHRGIQTGVTVWKCSIWVKIGNFLSHGTLKFDRCHWKTILWHLFYSTLSFVHHFKTISEFRLELQSRNAHFGSKLMLFTPCLSGWRGIIIACVCPSVRLVVCP